MMVNFRKSKKEVSGSLTLYDLVSDINQWEDRTAVIYDGNKGPVALTYHQMMSVSNMISAIIGPHVTAPDTVGLCIDPNQYMPAFLIGILKSGNAFLNIPASGFGHVKCVLDQQNISLLLIQSTKLETCGVLLSQYKMKQVLCNELSNLDVVLIKIYRRQEVWRERTSLAYTITTSGTTGKPKIVKVPHRCIVDNVLDQRKILGITEDDTVFLSSPLTFDPSIVELFMTLSIGACLLITSNEIKIRPKCLMQVLMKYNVSVMQCTPTLLERFDAIDLQRNLLGDNTSLRVLGLGGEKFPSLQHLQQRRAPRNQTKFFNLYGITEVSCWSSIYEVTERDISEMDTDVPLGEPITGTVFIVKDEDGQIITNGNGYLFIESSTRVCYLNDEKQYPENHPVQRSTGDIVSVHTDGRIIYVGRKDNQVKRHGKRIDMTEIEQIVTTVNYVKSVKVLFRDSLLAAFVVPRSEFSNGLTDDAGNDMCNNLNLYIQSYLPSHYWPDDIVFVENLPMTKHGKCDVDVLRNIFEKRRQNKTSEYNLPNFNLEEYLLCKWKEQLCNGVVGPDNLFIQSGGDSIRALQLASRIQSDLQLQLPWLLDFILHKPYREIFEKLWLELQQRKAELYNIDGNKRLDNHSTETVDIKKIDASEDVESKIFNFKRKRKFTESDKPTPDFKSSDIEIKDDMTLSSSAKISCNLRSISRCNKCSDWSVLEGGTIYDFKFYESCIPCMHFEQTRKLTIENSNNEVDVVPYTKVTCSVKCNFVLGELWKHDTGKCVDASPLIASLSDGKMVVFIGSHSHRFSAILLGTGQLLWETFLGGRIESSASMTMCGNYIVVGCYDYKIYALNSYTGDIWWTYETGGEVKSSPLVDPVTSLVIFGSHDQHLHAVNIQKQEVIWCSKINCGSIFASPCVSLEPHLIVCATLGGIVLAVNGESGILIWKYDCGKPVFSSPAITAIGTCVGCVDGSVYLLSFHGQQMWTFTTKGPIFSSPSYVDKKIFIGSHDCHMYCLNTLGDLIWKLKVESVVYSSAFGFSLSNKYCLKALDLKVRTKQCCKTNYKKYCSSSCLQTTNNENESCCQQSTLHLNDNIDNSYVTLASTQGDLFIVKSSSGEIIQHFKFPGEVFSSPVVFNDYLVVGCRNDFVYCLKIL